MYNRNAIKFGSWQLRVFMHSYIENAAVYELVRYGDNGAIDIHPDFYTVNKNDFEAHEAVLKVISEVRRKLNTELDYKNRRATFTVIKGGLYGQD
jgi:hypothetical protein